MTKYKKRDKLYNKLSDEIADGHYYILIFHKKQKQNKTRNKAPISHILWSLGNSVTFRLFVDLFSASNFLCQLEPEGLLAMTYEINKMSSEECNWAEEHWTKTPLSLPLRRKVTDAVDCADGCEYSEFRRREI